MEKQEEVGDEDWAPKSTGQFGPMQAVQVLAGEPQSSDTSATSSPYTRGPDQLWGDMSNLLLIMANISMFASNLLFLKELEQMEGDPESSIIPAHLPTRPEGKGMLGRPATGEAYIHSLHGLSCRPRQGGGGTHTDLRPFLIIQMMNHITYKVFWYLTKRRL